MTGLQQALLDLRLAYPQREVAVEALALYARQLDDLPEAEVVDAIYRLIRTAKFFPTVAEIREATVTGGATEGLAEAAWTEVRREVSRVGYGRGRELLQPARRVRERQQRLRRRQQRRPPGRR